MGGGGKRLKPGWRFLSGTHVGRCEEISRSDTNGQATCARHVPSKLAGWSRFRSCKANNVPADLPGDTRSVERQHRMCGAVRCGRAADGQHSGGARLTHTYPCAGLCRCDTSHVCA